jgi:hypothetical protein
MVKYLNVMPKTVKLLEENTKKSPWYLSGQRFLGYDSSGTCNEGKNRK